MNHVKELMIRARMEKDTKLSAFWSTVFSEIQKVGKDNGNRETTDKEAIAVLKKFISNTQETMERLLAHGKEEAAAEYLRELSLLNQVLPEKRPRDVTEAHVADIVKAQRGKKYGEIIKAVKEQLPDVEFDSSIVKLVEILTKKP